MGTRLHKSFCLGSALPHLVLANPNSKYVLPVQPSICELRLGRRATCGAIAHRATAQAPTTWSI
jgi:hypothetical protein